MKPVIHLADVSSVPAADDRVAINWEIGVRRFDEALSAEMIRKCQDRSVSRAVRFVGLLAFGQSLVFLLVWLLICANAGASTAKAPSFNPELQLSTYEPTKARDPFGKAGRGSVESKVVGGAAVTFQLQGILYHPRNPSAIVNGELLHLNKTVTLETPAGSAEIKAIEITRDRVVLEFAGQKVELSLGR